MVVCSLSAQALLRIDNRAFCAHAIEQTVEYDIMGEMCVALGAHVFHRIRVGFLELGRGPYHHRHVALHLGIRMTVEEQAFLAQ